MLKITTGPTQTQPQPLGSLPSQVSLTQLTNIGPFISAHSLTTGTVINDPLTNTAALAVAGYTHAGTYLEIINPTTGKGEVHPAPVRLQGYNSWAILGVPAQNLLILASSEGAFNVFDLDPSARKFLNSTPLTPDLVQRYAWSLAIGGDGRAYLGAGPPLALLALDFSQARSGKFSVENIPLPPEMATTFSSNEYLHYVIALPDGRLLCRFTLAGSANYIFDPSTKTFTTAGLPPELEAPFSVKPAPVLAHLPNGSTAIITTSTNPSLQLSAYDPISQNLVTSYGLSGLSSGASFSSNIAQSGEYLYVGIQNTSAQIAQINLSTGTATMITPPTPNLAAGSVLGHLQRIFANSDGTLTVSYLVNNSSFSSYTFSPALQTFTSIVNGGPQPPQNMTSGAVFGGLFFAGNRVFQVNADKSLSVVSPSNLLMSTPSGMSLSSLLSENSLGQLFLSFYNPADKKIHDFAYDSPVATPVEIPVAPPHSGQSFGFGSDHTQYGVMGEDFYTLSPMAFNAQLNQILKPIQDTPIFSSSGFLCPDPARNSLWAQPDIITQSLTSLNLSNLQRSVTQPLVETDGESYGVTVLTTAQPSSPPATADIQFGVPYLYNVTYAGGQITQYNPDAPWDATYTTNPRILTNLGSYVKDASGNYIQVQSYKRSVPLNSYVRPMTGIISSPDGTALYSGWGAAYGKEGGAIAITDPVPGPKQVNTTLIENPFGDQYPYGIIGLAASSTYLFIGTSPYVNGLPALTSAMKFGVVDLSKIKVGASNYLVYSKDFTPNDAVEKIIYDPGRNRALVLHHLGTLDIFDPQTMSWPLTTTSLPKAALNGDGSLLNSAVLCAPGFICYSSTNSSNQPLIVIVNMNNGNFTETATIGTAGTLINSMTVMNSKLYGLLGTNLFSLSLVSSP